LATDRFEAVKPDKKNVKFIASRRGRTLGSAQGQLTADWAKSLG